MNFSEIKNLIIHWIQEYSNNKKVLVVGVSGGIDSALTSKLCAMTGIQTYLVSMPIHQKEEEVYNAQQHMEWLEKDYVNITTQTIDLTDLFENYKKTIPIKYHSPLGLANARARLRMTTLYQIATKKNGLVVGTGNKVEDFGIGFFTKYGDGGVDISPIGDLTKSEVRKLAKICKIRKDILAAAPTDGLWDDGRTDESQIGATYEELEWAMNVHKRPSEFTEQEKRVIDIYQKLHDKNKHKMQPIPICNIPKDLRH